MHLHGSPRPRLRRLCLLFHHRPALGPPAGSAPALRGYKPRALLVTPGRRRAEVGLRRDRAHPGCHRPSLSRSDAAYRSGDRLGGSRTLTPSRAPTPRAGASAVPPRAVVVPPAGSAPATSGVSCRRSAWLSYAGEWPPRQGSHLRPPASKAGALSAELLGAGRACRTRTGVWLLERELSLAARRTTQGKLRAES